MIIRTLCPLLLAVSLCCAQNTFAEDEDLEMINRPVNMSGLTGLLITTTPYTLPTKTVEFATGALSENSTVPSYTLSELPSASLTIGIAQNMELALKSSYFRKTLSDDTRQRGAGDTELSYKWNFLPQTETSSNPAVALLLTAIAPGERDLDLGGVTHWGAKAGLSIGREIIWRDHVVGAYADGQVIFHDPGVKNERDSFGSLNIGFLVPISKYRNLQALAEYNQVTHVSRISTVGGDYTGITFGLRVVSERFNLTLGTQFLRKQVEGFENSSRVMGMASIKF